MLLYMLLALVGIGVFLLTTGLWRSSVFWLSAIVASSGLYCIQGKLGGLLTINAFRIISLLLPLVFFLNGRLRIRFPRFMGWYMILSVVYMISAFFAGQGKLFVAKIAVSVIGLNLLSYLLIYNLISIRRHLLVACSALCSMAFVLSVYGFFQLATNQNPLPVMVSQIPFMEWHRGAIAETFFRIQGLNVMRVKSVFWDPNLYAGFLVFSINIGIGFFFYQYNLPRRQWFKIVGIAIALLVSGLNLFVTFSRSGWLACFIGVLIFSFLLLLRGNRRTRRLVFLSALLLTVMLIYIGTNAKDTDFVEAFYERVNIEDLSEESHVILAQVAWDAIRERPLLGIGYGRFGEYFVNSPLAYKDNDRMHPHNAYLEWWSEVGILGLLINVLIIFILLRYLWKSTKYLGRKGDASGYFLYAGILSAYIAAWAGNLFYSYPYTNFTWTLMAIAASAVSLVYQDARSTSFQLVSTQA